MPMVNGQKLPYTKKGKAKAMKLAKKSGAKLAMKKMGKKK